MSTPHRVGLIVPSSNVTMETEIPALLTRHRAMARRGVTFHSSRAALHRVDPESLQRMVAESDRCAREPLTVMVIDYLAEYGITVTDSVSLEVAENVDVGRLDPADLSGHVKRLDLTGADALVLSACVQMPSLAALDEVSRQTQVPVPSAATATASEVLGLLGQEPAIGAGVVS